ncbi:MAG TPA: hypothetical protein VNO31_16140 [Umezawaea sp.]|nr:hypothetical protein [Umezawaea sp.]
MKWSIARHLSATLLPFVVVVFAIGWVCTTLLVLGISAVKDIRISGWDMTAAQLARWLVFGLGLHLARKLLQVAVVHGRTRREFVAQACAFTVVLTAVAAACTALGYVLESLVYRAAGWPQSLEQPHFDSGTDVPAIFVAYWAVFAVWTAAGMLVVSGFDRLQAGGVVTLLIGFALITPAVITVGRSGSLPFLRGFDLTATATLPLALGLCAASWAVGLALTWGLVRDVPIKAGTAQP